MSSVEVRYLVPDELRAIAAACKSVGDGGYIRKQFIKEMRVPVKKAADDVKQTVRSLPVSARATWAKGGSGEASRVAYNFARSGYKGAKRAARRGGLRSSIARGVRTSVRTSGRNQGLRVLVNEKVLPPDQHKLPAYLDSPKGWRHPLFGDRNYWVQQQGKPYFEVTLLSHGPEYQEAVAKVADDVARQLHFTR